MVDPNSAKSEDEDMSVPEQWAANVMAAYREEQLAPVKSAADLWYEHEEATRACLKVEIDLEHARHEALAAADGVRRAEQALCYARADREKAYAALLPAVAEDEQ